MGYRPDPRRDYTLFWCSQKVLHSTAELEREIYGKVVSHSVTAHLAGCGPPDMGLDPPKPPSGPGGGSRTAPRPDPAVIIPVIVQGRR